MANGNLTAKRARTKEVRKKHNKSCARNKDHESDDEELTLESEPSTIYIDSTCAHPNCSTKIRITHPYCRKHTREHYGVDVRMTATHGYSIFAWRDFEPGERIIEYTGEVIDRNEYERRYPNNNPIFVACLDLDNDQYFVDARRSDSGVARYFNHYSGIMKKPNASFVVVEKEDVTHKINSNNSNSDSPKDVEYGDNGDEQEGEEEEEEEKFDPHRHTVIVEAVQYIPKGKEITVDYGEDYGLVG